MLFSAKSFINRNKAVTDLLLQNQYKYPALPMLFQDLEEQTSKCPRFLQLKLTI
jgi:hypothetical protein